MTLKIFLDTEFTDFIRPHLISIGMVTDSGDEFYAEIPYPESECSDFVRETVIPLLGRFSDAIYSKEDLSVRLRIWLELVRAQRDHIEICVDSQTDWDLLINALEYQVPKWCRQTFVGNSIDELVRCDFYRTNKLPEHHALYDAMANRKAFR
ncbi:3'-5' exoribonuclease [Collimonas pratensis]|uniref:3'-5' exoribonuclease n=1 Tax=Collimonas pratensis TaxID=279113 RepID=UPI0007827F30|nr:3'-5' exoribonuclease [Collimonas pratensis]